MALAGTTTVTYPGARRPDRLSAGGLARRRHRGLRVGRSEAAPPLSCAPTAGSTSPATFDLVAPIVADAGWRVIAWDQRGHGDSDRAALYWWDADMRATPWR